MDKKKRSLFAGFICTAYIVTAVAFVASLGIDISKGRSAAVNRSRKLTNETNAILKDNFVRSEPFYDSFLRVLGDVSDIAGVQIKDSQGIVISYPDNLGADSTNFPGILVEPYTHDDKLHDKNGQEVNLKAAIHLLKPADFYKKARLTFLAILAETLICLLYLIYVSIFTDNESCVETEIVEEENPEKDPTSVRQPDEPKAQATAVSQATEVPQPAAVTKPPVVIVNVNSSPSGATTVETTRLTEKEASTKESQNSTTHEATVAMEEEEQPVFRNYELTQEEYQGLLAENLDEPKEDEDAADFDELDDLDEDENLDATLREGEDEDSDETIIQPKSEDDDLLDEEDDTVSLPVNGSDDLPDEEDDTVSLPVNGSDDLQDKQDDPATAQDTASPGPIAEENTEDKDDDKLFDSADDEDDFLQDADDADTFSPDTDDEEEENGTLTEKQQKHGAEDDDDALFDTLDETDDDEMEDFASEEVPTDAVPFQEDKQEDKDLDGLADEPLAELLEEEVTETVEQTVVAPADSPEEDQSVQEDTAEDTNSNWTPREIPAIDDSIFDENEEASGDGQDADNKFAIGEDESELEDNASSEQEKTIPKDDADILDEEEDIIVPVTEEVPESEEETTETQEEDAEPDEAEEGPEDEALPSDDELEDILDEETEEEADQTNDEIDTEPEPVPTTEEAAVPIPEDAIPVAPPPAPSGPTGLYSTRTGFGWESYMLPRMDNEISRCTKSGLDISVISLKIDGIDWTKDDGKAVCESVKDILSSPDLIFEKGDDAFTAALPDTNVNEAIGLAEDLYSSIDEILAQHGNDSPMGIGISSRSLRMISGERLTNEADVALNHAMEDEESPIVAFKVDPQKYRKFLAAQAEQEE